MSTPTTTTATITWHGPDPERPTMFKIIVRAGALVQHHARLSEGEYAALLDTPSLRRPSVVSTDAPPDVMADVMTELTARSS